MNARLHCRTEEEADIMGPWIFGKGREYIDNINEASRDNRELLITFCKANGMTLTNTFFQKPKEDYCTYKEMTTYSFQKPWNEDKFAMLVHC